jgi:hypothetical protein
MNGGLLSKNLVFSRNLGLRMAYKGTNLGNKLEERRLFIF